MATAIQSSKLYPELVEGLFYLIKIREIRAISGRKKEKMFLMFFTSQGRAVFAEGVFLFEKKVPLSRGGVEGLPPQLKSAPYPMIEAEERFPERLMRVILR